MERCGSRSEFSARISAKIPGRNETEVCFHKRHGCSLTSGLNFGVDGVHEDTHPLISCAVSINGAAAFARRFYLDTLIQPYRTEQADSE